MALKSVRQIKLSSYYIVVLALLFITGVLYTVLYTYENNGSMLINTSVIIWTWYALIIEAILLLGRYLTSMPKNPGTRKSVKVCVCIVSIVTIFSMYVTCLGRIDLRPKVYAEISSEDKEHSFIVMYIDMSLDADAISSTNQPEETVSSDTNDLPAETDSPDMTNVPDATDIIAETTAPAAEANKEISYRLYLVCKRESKYFCRYDENTKSIMLRDDLDARVMKEWSDDSFTLYIEGRRDDPNYCITVPLE